jgi:hypothetical protein
MTMIMDYEEINIDTGIIGCMNILLIMAEKISDMYGARFQQIIRDRDAFYG